MLGCCLVLAAACGQDGEPSATTDTTSRSSSTTVLADAEEGETAVWLLGSEGLPEADSPTFTALVSRLACSGGVTGEVLDPSIEVSADEVVVTFTVGPLPEGEGVYTCQGNTPVPYVVDLGEPLGARPIVDGACRSTEAASTSFCAIEEAAGGRRWPRPVT